MRKRIVPLVALLIAIESGFALASHSTRHPGKHAAARPAATIAGRISYVGADSNIHVCTAPCDQTTCITCPGKAEQARTQGLRTVALTGDAAAPPTRYNWPTYSPDASAIAYMSMQQGRGGASNFAVQVYDFMRRGAVTVFQSPSDRPIYLYWLPDSKRLFILVSDGKNLKLMLADAHESKPVRIILTGQPLFFDWDQALDELAFHYTPAASGDASRIALMRITDHDQRVVKIIFKGTAPFRCPSWSPDKSHLAYLIDNKNGQMALVVADADGAAPRQMVGLVPRTSSFVWAPDSKSIAFSTVRGHGSSLLDGVNLLDVASGDVKTLVSEPVLAFFFSPDGQRLAYIGSTGKSYTWNVIGIAGGKGRKLVNFIPTRIQSMGYEMFDQYALSHRIWSPDSKALVFAGVLVKQGEVPPAAAMPPSSIWILPVDGGTPQGISNGALAFWSPAP